MPITFAPGEIVWPVYTATFMPGTGDEWLWHCVAFKKRPLMQPVTITADQLRSVYGLANFRRFHTKPDGQYLLVTFTDPQWDKKVNQWAMGFIVNTQMGFIVNAQILRWWKLVVIA